MHTWIKYILIPYFFKLFLVHSFMKYIFDKWLITLGSTIFVSSDFFTVSYCIFHADFRSVFGFSLSSLFTEILRFTKLLITFKPVINRKNPITYLRSGEKSLLETIKNYVKQKNFEIFVSSNFLLFLSVFFMLISDLLSVFLYHRCLLRYWGLQNCS